MANTSIIDDLKHQYYAGGFLSRIIMVNVLVYLVWILILIGFKVATGDPNNIAFFKFLKWFSLPSDLGRLIMQPWSIFTHFFMHDMHLPGGLFHLFFNMYGLYIFGKILTVYMRDKQFAPLYFMSALFGAFTYVLAYNIFNLDGDHSAFAVGASAAVMGVVLATTVYDPNYQLRLVFLGNVRILWIAAIYVLVDVFSLGGSTNLGGHIAHLGGAFFGAMFMLQWKRGNDWSIPINKFWDFISRPFQRRKSPRVAYINEEKLKRATSSLKKAKSNSGTSKSKQQRIDEILDKISEEGYENLSGEEKEFLFQISKEE